MNTYRFTIPISVEVFPDSDSDKAYPVNTESFQIEIKAKSFSRALQKLEVSLENAAAQITFSDD